VTAAPGCPPTRTPRGSCVPHRLMQKPSTATSCSVSTSATPPFTGRNWAGNWDSFRRPSASTPSRRPAPPGPPARFCAPSHPGRAVLPLRAGDPWRGRAGSCYSTTGKRTAERETRKIGGDDLLRRREAAVPEDGDRDVATQAQYGAVIWYMRRFGCGWTRNMSFLLARRPR
jgi:hypothetical protein